MMLNICNDAGALSPCHTIFRAIMSIRFINTQFDLITRYY